MPSNLLPPAQIAAIRERCEKSLPNTMGKWPGDVVLPLLSHADAQAARIEELEKALSAISNDMHQVSTRPCGTCEKCSKATGSPFGCYLVQARMAALKGTP